MTRPQVVSDELRTEVVHRTRHRHIWVPFNHFGTILGWCRCGKVNRG